MSVGLPRVGRERLALFLIGVVPAAAILFWHAQKYLPFMADDAFISLRYARRLLHGQGLTWTEGPRVEGYSNLLWVLLCALAGSVIPLVLAVRVVGGLASLGLLVAVAWWGSAARARLPATLCAALLLALASPLAVWTFGGLEQPLVAALLAVAVLNLFDAGTSASPRKVLPAALALSALALTRPDSLLFVVTLGFGFAVHAGRALLPRSLALVVGAPFATACAQLLFRRAYYGAWVPNPALLKVAWTTERLRGGWDYVSAGGAVLAPALVFGVAGLIALAAQRSQRRAVPLVLLPPLAWLGYVVAIGGDIFPARRHLVPLLVLSTLSGLVGLGSLALRSALPRLALALTGLAGVTAHFVFTPEDAAARAAKDEQWEWAGEVSGRFFAQAFRAARPTLAVDSAGCVPFFSNLPAIDMLGLNDAYIPHHLPKKYGTASIGFDLHSLGNAGYVLRREPELILPCGPLGSETACDSVPWERRLFEHRDFRAQYQPLRFRGEHPFRAEGTAWVRKCSTIARSTLPQGIAVEPALLANGGGVMRLGPAGLFVEMLPQANARVDQLPHDGVVVELDADGALTTSLAAGVLHVENHGASSASVRRVIIAGAVPPECNPATGGRDAGALSAVAATR